MAAETFIIAQSEAAEAEYGQCADAPFTVIGLFEGEVFVVYGASAFAAAKAELLADGATAAQISTI